MTTETKQLEQRAESERQALSRSVGKLTSSLRGGSEAAQDVANKIVSVGRGNPAALAVIGAGAAMLAVSAARGERKAPLALPSHSDPYAAHTAPSYAAPKTSASQMDGLLDKGLDKLPPEARKRVMEARSKAVEMQRHIEQKARKASSAARARHNDQPIVTGLLAAGLGAAIGALLPSTRAETELMGAKRDQLIRDAEAIFRDEVKAMQSRAENAMSAAVDAARETPETRSAGQTTI